MVILVPFLVCLIGLIVYALSNNAKVAELGRLAFSVGLLVTLLDIGGAAVRLFNAGGR